MSWLAHTAMLALAAPKLKKAIDVEWVIILLPILAIEGHRYLEHTLLQFEAIAIKLSGSAKAANRFCDRLEAKEKARHRSVSEAITNMRRQFGWYLALLGGPFRVGHRHRLSGGGNRIGGG